MAKLKLTVDSQDAVKGFDRADKAGKDYARGGAEQAQRATNEVSGSFDRAKNQGGRLTQTFTSLRSGAKGVAGALVSVKGAVAGLGLIGAAEGFRRLSTSVVSAGNSIDKAAQTAGVGAEKIQELRFAFGQLGDVTNIDVDNALRRFNRRLGDARDGSGTLNGELQSLNITAGQKTPEALDSVLERLAGIENSSERSRLAAKAFGEDAGPALAGALSEGTEALREQISVAQRFGIVLSEDAIENAAKLQDEFTLLGQIIQRNFQAGFLENFQGEFDTFREAISDSDFRQSIEDFGNFVSGGLEFIVDNSDSIASGFRGIASAVSALATAANVFIDIGEGIGTALGQTVTGGVATSVEQIENRIASLRGELEKASSAGGIPAVIGDKSEIRDRIELLQERLESLRDIQDQTKELGTAPVVDGTNEALEETVGTVRTLSEEFQLLGQSIPNLEVKQVGEDLEEALQDRLEELDIQREARRVGERIGDSLSDALISGDFEGVGDAIGAAIGSSVGESVAESVTGALSESLGSTAGGAVGGAAGAVVGGLAGQLVGGLFGGGSEEITRQLNFAIEDAIVTGFEQVTIETDDLFGSSTSTVFNELGTKVTEAVENSFERTTRDIGSTLDSLGVDFEQASENFQFALEDTNPSEFVEEAANSFLEESTVVAGVFREAGETLVDSINRVAENVQVATQALGPVDANLSELSSNLADEIESNLNNQIDNVRDSIEGVISDINEVADSDRLPDIGGLEDMADLIEKGNQGFLSINERNTIESLADEIRNFNGDIDELQDRIEEVESIALAQFSENLIASVSELENISTEEAKRNIGGLAESLEDLRFTEAEQAQRTIDDARESLERFSDIGIDASASVEKITQQLEDFNPKTAEQTASLLVAAGAVEDLQNATDKLSDSAEDAAETVARTAEEQRRIVQARQSRTAFLRRDETAQEQIERINEQIDATIRSQSALDEFVQSLDLTTESGREAFDQVQPLAGAINEVANESQNAASQIKQVTDQLQSIADIELAGDAAAGLNTVLESELSDLLDSRNIGRPIGEPKIPEEGSQTAEAFNGTLDAIKDLPKEFADLTAEQFSAFAQQFAGDDGTLLGNLSPILSNTQVGDIESREDVGQTGRDVLSDLFTEIFDRTSEPFKDILDDIQTLRENAQDGVIPDELVDSDNDIFSQIKDLAENNEDFDGTALKSLVEDIISAGEQIAEADPAIEQARQARDEFLRRGESASEQIDRINDTLDTSIESQSGLNDFVEGLNLTTEAGREAFEQAQPLAQALRDVARAEAEAAEEARNSAIQSAQTRIDRSLLFTDEAPIRTQLTAQGLLGGSRDQAAAFLRTIGDSVQPGTEAAAQLRTELEGLEAGVEGDIGPAFELLTDILKDNAQAAEEAAKSAQQQAQTQIDRNEVFGGEALTDTRLLARGLTDAGARGLTIPLLDTLNESDLPDGDKASSILTNLEALDRQLDADLTPAFQFLTDELQKNKQAAEEAAQATEKARSDRTEFLRRDESAAEQIERINDALNTSIESQSGLNDFVRGLDLTTESGREALDEVQPLASALRDLASAEQQAQQQIVQARQSRTEFLRRDEGPKAQIERLNNALGTSIGSQSGLNDFVESLDLTAEAGREAFEKVQPLAGALRELADAEEQAAQQAQKRENDAIRDVIDARKTLIDQLEKEQQQAEETAQSFRRIGEELEKFQRGIQFGNDSPLSPQEQLNQARTEFMDVRNRALGIADVSQDEQIAAQERLSDVSDRFLEQARGFFASGQGFQDAFSLVNDTVDAVEQNADEQISAAERTANSLETQVQAQRDAINAIAETTDAIDGLNDPIDSVKDAVDRVRDAIVNAPTRAATGNVPFGGPSAVNDAVNNAPQSTGTVTDSTIDDILNAANGNTIVRPSGVTVAPNRDFLDILPDDELAQVAAGAGVPGFATGGIAGPGLARVGENGPELVNFPQTAEVISNSSARNDQAMAQEMRALREEVKQLRQATVVSGEQVTQAVQDGNKSLRNQERSARLKKTGAD